MSEVNEQRGSSEVVDRQARVLAESLNTGSGWHKEHGRMHRSLIIREDASELASTKQVYERAAELLQEQGYAARFHCQPHDPESGVNGYVQMAICIGR